MARPVSTLNDRDLLEAALTGLELQRQKIDEQIQTVRTRLGIGAKKLGRSPSGAPKMPAKKASEPLTKRVLSVGARRRIAAAQKRRWAEYRKTAASKG